MKKQLAKWLVSLAGKLDPKVEVKDDYVARQVGIGIHITKNDVRNFRKLNPVYDSHLKGLNALIEDTKKKALLNILTTLMEKGIVEYEVNKTLLVADVKTVLKVYVPKEKG